MFYPVELVERARANAAKYPWAAAIRSRILEAAEPWMRLSDDALWRLMFGNTLRRSWMVWSNGHCPSCKKGVPMYNWVIDAFARPWKLQCPHCRELFPKNDFHRFYLSGLDEHNVFAPERADRSLLFNTEHPDPADPLHDFGVDDGNAYVEGEKRWWFVATYLIYGQWKQLIVAGICNLAAAHTITGEPGYAHRAAILLDRVADLYPTFDFKTEGVMYEGPAHAGYVSTWHDACEETREMVLAYDQIQDALRSDAALVGFLSDKAKQYGLSNPKASFEDIRRNIEDRILRDAVKNAHKIHSNYPRTPICLATIAAVLGEPGGQDETNRMLDEMIEKATAVDGVTGEKGLAGYSAYVIQGLAGFLELFARKDPNFLPSLLARHPKLRQTYRFHIDTWCLQKYYPLAGDTGSFAGPIDQYVGVALSANPGVGPSMYSFLYRLYELTGDAAYVQVLHRANGGSVEGLPHDLFAEDPEAIQAGVRTVIESKGPAVSLGSVNKEEWHLAILRSGKGEYARAAWLKYDSGGGHGHADGMNLGLFAYGLDLMPDFGYPPVNHGGWGAPRAVWYTTSAAHNTVVVDGKNHRGLWNAICPGKTTLWRDCEGFRAIRVSAPEMIEGEQFERTLALVDISERDFYLVDIFRVVGGTDHAKFMHSHFGTVAPQGLALEPLEGADLQGFWPAGLQMRNFQYDPSPESGWSVEWRIEDRYKLLPPGSDIRLRYTDLTTDVQAYLCEGWVSVGSFNSTDEAWIPRLMVRRQSSEAPLVSTFVSVIEPYEGTSKIASVRRVPLKAPDTYVGLEVTLADGRRDLIYSADVQRPVTQAEPPEEARPWEIAGTTAVWEGYPGADAELAFRRIGNGAI